MIRLIGEPATLALLLTVGLVFAVTLVNPALIIAASAAWAAWDSVHLA